MEKIINVQHLSFGYDEDTLTIDDISFTIEKGSYTTILGHNGSGKSTIAKLLMGLLEKKSGEIVIGGIPLTEETLNQVRSQIGIVFQKACCTFRFRCVQHAPQWPINNKPRILSCMSFRNSPLYRKEELGTDSRLYILNKNLFYSILDTIPMCPNHYPCNMALELESHFGSMPRHWHSTGRTKRSVPESDERSRPLQPSRGRLLQKTISSS